MIPSQFKQVQTTFVLLFVVLFLLKASFFDVFCNDLFVYKSTVDLLDSVSISFVYLMQLL